MPFLKNFDPNIKLKESPLTGSEIFSVFYHNIFAYPLTFSELVKWLPKNHPSVNAKVIFRNGYYFIEGKEGLIYKRNVRRRFSQNKLKLAEKAARILKHIPLIKMIGVTGSLAMENAKKGSDIDLIIITKKRRLWTTRIYVYTLLKIFGMKVRQPGKNVEEDKLCLNIWLDESDLTWPKNSRNIFTAHEILQIKPLLNREQTYEKLLARNKWAFNYWPNAVSVRIKHNDTSYTKLSNLNLIESLAYRLQKRYMSPKHTRETVKPTRAFFHPVNLSRIVLGKMIP